MFNGIDLVKQQKKHYQQQMMLQGNLVKDTSKMKKRKSNSKGKKGRVSGDRNFKQTGSKDGFLNQHGVEFTKSEREQIRQAINSIKRKQKKLLNNPEKYKAEITFYSQSGFLNEDFSTSMNQFKSRQHLEFAMKKFNKIRQRGYEKQDMQNVKDSYIKSLSNTFDSEFIDYLKNMSLTEFFTRRGSDAFQDMTHYNSDFLDDDDVYAKQLYSSFGYLTPEERENNDIGWDRVLKKQIKPKKKK